MTVNGPNVPQRWTQPDDEAPPQPLSPEVEPPAPSLQPYPSTHVGAAQQASLYGAHAPYGVQAPYAAQPAPYGAATPYGGPAPYPGQFPNQGQPTPYPAGALPYAGQPGPMPYNGQPGPMPYSGQAPLAWQGPRVAEFWRRLVARFIDTVVAGAVLVGLAFAMGDTFGTLYQTGSATSGSFFYSVNGGGILVILGISLINEVLLVATLGGQVGKLVMGLRIARQRDAKIPAGPGWLLGRWFLLTVAFSFCFVPGLVMALSPLWGGPLLQGWHDKAFQTVVVRKPVEKA